MPLRKIQRISAKYAAVASIAARNRLAYPKDLIGRTLFVGFILFVYSQLWGRVLGARGDFSGFTRAQLTWYMAFTEGIMLSFPRLQNAVSEDVKTGNIAYRLNRPLSYLGYLLAQFLGKAAVNVAIALTLAAGVAWALVGGLPGWAPGPLALAAGAALGGVFLSFLLMASLAMTAFWVEDNGPYFWLYSKINFVLGGLFIPVEVYPGFLRTLAEFLPFRLIFAGAARLAVRFEMGIFARILAAQACWLAVLAFMAVLIYRKGVRKLNVNGG